MDFVRNGAREANLPAARMDELDLVVEEIYVNICRYASEDHTPPTVAVTYWVPAPGELKVEVADRGIEFDPLKPTPVDVTLDLEHRPIGGLGIFLVKHLAASLSYRREDGWNRLTFGISS